jgi:hypothetical protein
MSIFLGSSKRKNKRTVLSDSEPEEDVLQKNSMGKSVYTAYTYTYLVYFSHNILKISTYTLLNILFQNSWFFCFTSLAQDMEKEVRRVKNLLNKDVRKLKVVKFSI